MMKKYCKVIRVIVHSQVRPNRKLPVCLCESQRRHSALYHTRKQSY